MPLAATVHVVGDVVLFPPQDGSSDVQVITRTPPLRDDLMTLHVVDEDDDAGRVVRVVDTRPVIVAGQLRHEVQLQQAEPPVDGRPGAESETE